MSEPTRAELRTQVEELMALGDAPAALSAARRLWAIGSDAAVARFITRRGDALQAGRPLRRHRVAILRSFTVEPLAPLLEAEAVLAGCRLDLWIGAYNAYAQEILDPSSGLYGHRPDTVILALQTRDVAPDLWTRFEELTSEDVAQEVDRAAQLLIDLLGALRRTSSATLFCHGLETPLDAAAGLLETSRELRQADAIAEVNRRLRAWCAGQSGVHVMDYDGVIGRHGRERWFDEKKYAATRLPMSLPAVGWLAAEWWRWLSVVALPQAKVLALDLDNTLWGGVLGEDGVDGIRMGLEPPGLFYRELQQAVVDISRRGILVVLVSKNNEADAFEILDGHADMLVRRHHLAGWRINWDPKPANLVALAQELNLGVDSFVFVDDNPAECDAVRRALPEVDVVELSGDPSTYAPLLRQIPRLERLTLSREDAERTRYYADERERRDLQASAASLEDFLASLQVEISIEPVAGANLSRAAQLTQKTNQLNTTTRRYTEPELARLLEDPAWSGSVLRARDRFGDNGVVGLALVHARGETHEIDTFLMSCRVIGRGIERAFLADLAEAARQRGAAVLEGWFLPTPKNPPAARIYADAGFTLARTDGGNQLWRHELRNPPIETPAWIRVVEPQRVSP